MSEIATSLRALSRLTKPSGPPPPGQPWWNPQRLSSMPAHRYARAASRLPEELADRSWPAASITQAPLWCSVDLRDGNQALPSPMDSDRKGAMFNLLVQIGMKEIEVGYPSASETDFNFVRELIRQDRIPDDVTISVFTPARTELIERTFEAIQGVDRAVVHLCLATACLWREVVFDLTRAELQALTVRAAEHVVRLADRTASSQLRFEYSPETFNVTEADFALEVSNAVAATWSACPDRPVTLNLPTTVETDSPNVFADQVEWMHRALNNRQSIILSVHPHNDRGTAVATAELALMAGADRVEGTLFGNGERTGNVCLATLALNLFSRGIDPQLDFSDIDYVRRVVERCNQLPVPARYPYAGDLVYTAFSGTHQDAIAKGLEALAAHGRRTGQRLEVLPWQVPYLPVDPRDVGRTYESVVRVNSQSGKGGIAHIIKQRYGLDLPRRMRIEFARTVQEMTDASGSELNSLQLWDTFKSAYLAPDGPLHVRELSEQHTEGLTYLTARLAVGAIPEVWATGIGATAMSACQDLLAQLGYQIQIQDVTEHIVTGSTGDRTAVYVNVAVGLATAWGCGLDGSPAVAVVGAVLSAVNRIEMRVPQLSARPIVSREAEIPYASR